MIAVIDTNVFVSALLGPSGASRVPPPALPRKGFGFSTSSIAAADVGAEDGVDYLVMEYVEGTPLEERLRTGPLKLAGALDAALDVAAALDTANRRHRLPSRE